MTGFEAFTVGAWHADEWQPDAWIQGGLVARSKSQTKQARIARTVPNQHRISRLLVPMVLTASIAAGVASFTTIGSAKGLSSTIPSFHVSISSSELIANAKGLSWVFPTFGALSIIANGDGSTNSVPIADKAHTVASLISDATSLIRSLAMFPINPIDDARVNDIVRARLAGVTSRRMKP